MYREISSMNRQQHPVDRRFVNEVHQGTASGHRQARKEAYAPKDFNTGASVVSWCLEAYVSSLFGSGARISGVSRLSSSKLRKQALQSWNTWIIQSSRQESSKWSTVLYRNQMYTEVIFKICVQFLLTSASLEVKMNGSWGAKAFQLFLNP